MINKLFISIFSLIAVVLLISSVLSFGNYITNTNTASIISSLVNFFSSEDNISDCTMNNIDLQCPENANIGCYCNGGVLGLENRIWQGKISNQSMTYFEAQSYCSSLGDEWGIPSPEDLFSIYNYDVKYIYSDIQPINPSWFISSSSIFWTNYEYQSKPTFMLIGYNLINAVSDLSLSFPVICIKNHKNHDVYVTGKNLIVAGMEDLTILINGKYIKEGDLYKKDNVTIYYDGYNWRLTVGDANWLKGVDSGVVINNGMMWQKAQSDTELTWNEGNNYCNSLVVGEFDDWRLPSRIEVESICSAPELNGCANNYWADSGQEDYYMPSYNSWNSNAGGYAPATTRCIRENITTLFGEYYPIDTYQSGVITVSETDNPIVSSFPISITNFYFQESVPAMSEINEEEGTIVFRVPSDYYNFNLTPIIGFNRDLDMGESIIPSSGERQNFSSPIAYTITLADGRTKNYVVSVIKQEGLMGNESQVIDIAIKQAMYNVNIDETNKKITIGVSAAADMNNFVYIVRVSNGATLNTSSGYVTSNDGSSGYIEHQYMVYNQSTSTTYTITSEDGKSVTNYTVSLAYPPTVSLDVSNPVIYEKQTAKIIWTPIGAVSCEASGNDIGWINGSSPSATDGQHIWTTGQLDIDSINTPKIYTYGINCSNDAGNTSVFSKTIKVLPDIYTTERGSSRMSTIAMEAGVSGLNEFVLIKTDIRKIFENPKAHQVTCPTGYTLCIEDNNDDNGNYVLIGVKQ